MATNTLELLSHEIRTFRHIRNVASLLFDFTKELHKRAIWHDTSKLEFPELAIFQENATIPEYGTPEYENALEVIQEAKNIHYAKNRHHPEHHARGVNDMSLIDLIELLCDWRAAVDYCPDGCIKKSLLIGKERFKFSPQLVAILNNTVKELGWVCNVRKCDEIK